MNTTIVILVKDSLMRILHIWKKLMENGMWGLDLICTMIIQDPSLSEVLLQQVKIILTLKSMNKEIENLSNCT